MSENIFISEKHGNHYILKMDPKQLFIYQNFTFKSNLTVNYA